MQHRLSRVMSVMLVIALLGALGLPGVSLGKDKGDGVSTQDVIFVPADTWESDDGTATAQALPAVSSHTLHRGDDEDWMTFSIDESSTPVAFETQLTGGNDGFDTRMWLFELNEDGTLDSVTDSDDHEYWNSYSQELVTYLDPGTYMLCIKGYTSEFEDTSDETGSYDLYWNEGYARRLYGASRYDTAVEVSKLMYQEASTYYDDGSYLGGFVIASGADPADGIAGSLLASMMDSTLQLSGSTGLSDATLAEMQRALLPAVYYDQNEITIYILGGTNAVPANVETQLEALPIVKSAMESGLLEIVRIAGDNRYDTAAQVAVEYDDVVDASTTAYLVNGTAWADALTAAAPAVYEGSVILSSRVDTIPVETLDAMDAIGIDSVVVIGGESVINSDVYEYLENRFGVGLVERIWGATRYETALEVARYGVDHVSLNSNRFVLASGMSFADAMVAGPMSYGYAGEYGMVAPILLTSPTSLSSEVTTFMDEYGAPEFLCYVLGGPAALSDAVVDELNAYRVPMLP